MLGAACEAKLVDDATDTHSNKTRESLGQGAANIITGFFGGMGGCAMIGQTMISVKVSGARTRISTFLAGVFLLILVVGLGDYQFDYTGDPANVVIDMSGSHIWDASTVATLDAIVTKYAAKGKTATIVGMNEASAERHQRLAGHLGG